MNKKLETSKDAADKLDRNIRRMTRQTYSTEKKVRIVLAGFLAEENISALSPDQRNLQGHLPEIVLGASCEK